MKLIDILAITLLVSIWGTAYTITGYTMKFVPIMLLYAIRFFLAGLFLLPFSKLPKTEIKKIIIFGIMQGFIFVFIGILILVFLSNIIFNIEVVHNDKELRNLIVNELENYDIKKYKFKKSYNEIQSIKDDILNKYQDKIEWLEIEEKGTSYIVRVEPRIIPNNEVSYEKQNVVASKSAIIKKIITKSGEVVKNINSYVNQGDIIISGNIYLNEEIKDTVKADGIVYGEVWYNVKVEYPYIYSEIKETNNYQDIYVLKIFDKSFEFTSNKFQDKKIDEKIILQNNILPIYLVKQKQQELKTISLLLTSEEALDKALEEAVKKMNEGLSDDEQIINYKILNFNIEEDKVILDVFFTVYEDITSYSKIEEKIEGE